MPAPAFPKDLKPLTSLRFWAALWVVLFHYRPYAGYEVMGLSVLEKGYLGVDFFFVLSGFVLAHVYGESLRNKTYRHLGFIQKRIARIYPMHIATLAVLVVVALVAPALGLKLDSAARYDFRELPEQVLLVHAWVGTGEEFNYPSWSISAEFFAYLCFPLVMMLSGRPRLMALLGLAAVFGWYFGAILVTGRTSTHLADWQIMRIMPEFMLGAGLRVSMAHVKLPLLSNRCATAATAALVLALATLNAPDWLMLAALIALLAAAAERARSGREGFLEAKQSLYLGEISYALYMVHVPAAMAWFEMTNWMFGAAVHVSLLSVAVVAGGIIAAILVAALCERVIERPGRKWIGRLGQSRRSRPQSEAKQSV